MDKVDGRTARQLETYSKWSSIGKGTFEAATGFGKTRIGLMALRDMNKRWPGKHAMVVVPTRQLQSQWLEELEDWGIKDTTVIVINTAIKKDHHVFLLILDEIHNMAAKTFRKIFDCVKYQFILGLTATLERIDKKHGIIEAFAPIFDQITLTEARKKGYIADFTTINLGVGIDSETRSRLTQLDALFQKYFAWFGQDFNIAKACLGKEYRTHYANNIGADEAMLQVYAVQLMHTVRKRKEILYEAVAKIDVAVELVKRFPDKKIIIFSLTTATADELTRRLDGIAASYHSNQGKKANRAALKKFKDNRYKVRVLNVAKAVDEGFDIEDASLAIILAGDSSKRRNIQRTGRVVRFLTGKKALVVNLYVKDSQDESWLVNRQKGEPVIYVDKIEEVTYERTNNEARIYHRKRRMAES